METFDVIFNNSSNSNSKGFELSENDAIDYIKTWNGSNHSYFQDYKGGTVSVVSNKTDEIVYSETVI